MTQLGYRFSFYDDDPSRAVAVFIVHYADEAHAFADADAFLELSNHFRVEVSRGSNRLYEKSKTHKDSDPLTKYVGDQVAGLVPRL